MKTCFFMGAHDAPDRIQGRLDEIVEYLVAEQGIRECIVGFRGNFDTMAIGAIRRTLLNHPDIPLTALLLEPYPFDGREHPLPAHFHGFHTPEGLEGVPKRFCIQIANRKALEASDAFVTFSYFSGSNSGKLLGYARRLEAQGLLKVYAL